MGHSNSPHPTLNAGILESGQEDPNSRSRTMPSCRTTSNTEELAMIHCNSCNTPANGLLKTPHGWVCPKCYKLIYVPDTADIPDTVPPGGLIRSLVVYDPNESYETEAWILAHTSN